jgi:hypothetical protein
MKIRLNKIFSLSQIFSQVILIASSRQVKISMICLWELMPIQKVIYNGSISKWSIKCLLAKLSLIYAISLKKGAFFRGILDLTFFLKNNLKNSGLIGCQMETKFSTRRKISQGMMYLKIASNIYNMKINKIKIITIFFFLDKHIINLDFSTNLNRYSMKYR